MKLGCIGDDFTGSSDLANTLSKQGMRVTQYSGIPTTPAASDVEAGVISLKSRSIKAADAVSQSLAALEWLRAQGCTQFFFKYCSTFDSTPEGNIGPVADALGDTLGTDCVIFCPAFPGTGRSVYNGHLFVKDRLLNESGMENHPLTPMTDANIRRWLGLQSQYPVGHVRAQTVFEGAEAIIATLSTARKNGQRNVVVDAIRDEDLMEIGRAAAGLPLVTGGSGVALGLPRNFGCTPGTPAWKGQSGRSLALSGSCSSATRAQVAYHAKSNPARQVAADDIIEERVTIRTVLDWAMDADGLPLVYSSADPEVVEATQKRFGRDEVATTVENFFADLARLAVGAGVTRLITAGGETSGAVADALSLSELAIGPEIDPGVPALRASPNLVLALKSGNFGAENFFDKADRILST